MTPKNDGPFLVLPMAGEKYIVFDDTLPTSVVDVLRLLDTLRAYLTGKLRCAAVPTVVGKISDLAIHRTVSLSDIGFPRASS